MRSIFSTPLDQLFYWLWTRLSAEYKSAFFIVVVLNLLAFGYEMTNLTLHHDDVGHILIQDPYLAYDLGRFGLAWLYYYGQGAHFMPFLQMSASIILMTSYGMLMAHFWGATRTIDIVLVASVLSVFPFMAQIYQYNTAMFSYPLAHFLAGAAVVLSVRATATYVVAAAVLYMIAFSIYQSVAASAATIFLVWVLARLLFAEAGGYQNVKEMVKSSGSALLAVFVGGLIYLAALAVMDVQIDTYQGADKAFTLSDGIDPGFVATEIVKGTRSFFFWPENYFPESLKNIQLVFVAAAAFLCLALPRTFAEKVSALAVVLLILAAPRSLQALHPEGHFHNLTLTGYAVAIAGFVMIVNRAGPVLVRNCSIALAIVLVAGYVIQCNWISTVNQLNTYAHYSTMSQILGRIKSLAEWKGKKVVVVGTYDMPSEYPYKPATGVATEFIDATHMQELARLMREKIKIVPAEDSMTAIHEYAEHHSGWPNWDSVGVVEGVAVVVLSKAHVVAEAGQADSRPD